MTVRRISAVRCSAGIMVGLQKTAAGCVRREEIIRGAEPPGRVLTRYMHGEVSHDHYQLVGNRRGTTE